MLIVQDMKYYIFGLDRFRETSNKESFIRFFIQFIQAFLATETVLCYLFCDK